MIYPVPKPSGGKRAPKGLTRTRMKQRPGGKAFKAVRDPAHCRWVVTETPCVGLGRFFQRRISVADYAQGAPDCLWVHRCWGPHDPAHVGKHRAQGVPDLGRVVNMCRALHDFYDQHRDVFAKVTGLTERKLALIASGNGLKYSECGGLRAGTDPPGNYFRP